MRALPWLLVIALWVPSTASADVCKHSGDVVIEVDQDVTPKVKKPTATTKVFANGAWTLEVVSAAGKVSTRTGCVQQARFDRLRDLLKAATWTLVHRSVTCRSDSPRFTIYKLAGRAVYQERPCSPDALDRADQDMLDQLALLVPIPNLDLDDRKTCLDNPLAPGCN